MQFELSNVDKVYVSSEENKVFGAKNVNIKVPEGEFMALVGPSGSGKTTLMKHIKEHYKNNSKIIFACEPVEEWAKITDEHGTEMLKLFYN